MELCEIRDFGYGRIIGTPRVGSRIRKDLERKISKLRVGDTILVSFEEVDDVGGSIVREVVCDLVAARKAGLLPAVAIVYAKVNPWIKEIMDAYLHRRSLSAALEEKGGALTLLGGDVTLIRAYETIRDMDRFRAQDLATLAGVTPQNANNWLKRLVEVGALTQPERIGREFIYALPQTLTDRPRKERRVAVG